MLADRVDAVGEHVKSFATLRPDNPITENRDQGRVHPPRASSRIGRKRTDLVHQPLDPVIVAGPWWRRRAPPSPAAEPWSGRSCTDVCRGGFRPSRAAPAGAEKPGRGRRTPKKCPKIKIKNTTKKINKKKKIIKTKKIKKL
jgi:hypothetical protein